MMMENSDWGVYHAETEHFGTSGEKRQDEILALQITGHELPKLHKNDQSRNPIHPLRKHRSNLPAAELYAQRLIYDNRRVSL